MLNQLEKNHPDNYFSLLALPVSFSINKKVLTSHYHEIQKSIHPDKYANASDLERRLSVQKAAQINDALDTLKNPLQRSIYLLSLLGVDLGENSQAVDTDFLMGQMELREHLSRIESQMDPFAELDTLMDDVKSRIQSATEIVSTLFADLLSRQTDDSQHEILLNELTAQVLKMQYLYRLEQECLNKEEDLADHI